MISLGMDAYIWKSKTRKIFDEENWWNNPNVTEVWYSRKPWEMLQHCSFIPKDYESGDFLEIDLDMIEEMIVVACNYRNSRGNYDEVPKLCEVRDQMRASLENEEQVRYFLEYDW